MNIRWTLVKSTVKSPDMGGFVRFDVPQLRLTMKSPYHWYAANWNNGKPIGVNKDGMTATELYDMKRKLQDIVADMPESVDREKLRKYLHSILFGLPLREEPKVILTDIVNRYVQSHALSGSTQSQLKRLGKLFGKTELDQDNVRGLLMRQRDRLRPSSFNLILGQTKRMLDYGYRTKMIPSKIDLDLANNKDVHNEPIYLTTEQLDIIRNLDLPEKLDYERNLFLLQSYTGLRSCDVIRLTTDNIRDGAIHILMRKTGRSVTIPITDPTEKLLHKVIGMNAPATSNRDHYIKKICRIAGFDTPVQKVIRRGNNTETITKPMWEFIGTHTARRSFICNLLAADVPLTTITAMTGHTDFGAVQAYIRIGEKLKRKALEKISG